MKAISAYMANRSAQRGGNENRRSEYGGNENRRSEYGGNESRRSEYEGAENRRSEYGGRGYAENRMARQPNQYTRRNEMDEGWPEDNEMRRRRDSRGRYMMEEDESPESRYRGRDGRWKPGRRRRDMTGMRMEDDDEDGEEMRAEMRTNVIPWPYAPSVPQMPAENRRIGFGNQSEYETRSHYGGGRKAAEVGGTMWMQPMDEEEPMEMTREKAEKWVRSMRNEDTAKPTGGKWTMEDLKPMAQKLGVPAEGKKFYEFYAMTNAMYSDYCAVAKKFNITSPEFYGMMAKAWMEDKDGVEDKTAMYYECCVEK